MLYLYTLAIKGIRELDMASVMIYHLSEKIFRLLSLLWHLSYPCPMCKHKLSLTMPFTFSVETVRDHGRYIPSSCHRALLNSVTKTEHGVLLVTTLNNFRSDYNLILIPDGNFLAAREQLYVNINLLRMGCSGRSALTLEEPR
jgi:hypothetical protein